MTSPSLGPGARLDREPDLRCLTQPAGRHSHRADASSVAMVRLGSEKMPSRLALAVALALSLTARGRAAYAQERPAAPAAAGATSAARAAGATSATGGTSAAGGTSAPAASPGASSATGTPPEPAASPGASSDECPDADAAGTCLVGVRRLVGSVAASVDYAGRSASLGLGYLQTSLRRASYDASQRSDWYAYGVNARAFLGGSNEGVRGWGGAAIGRVGVGRRVGALLEVTAGAARGDGRTLAFGTAGLFATIYYVDLGYSFQTPLGSERPEWLGTHLLSIRAHLPIVQWSESEWRSSAGWFPGS